MKNFILILPIILLVLIVSCSKEDTEDIAMVNSGLVGTWNLINTSGGFAGISCDYQEGEIVFVFDSEDTLSISSNVINTSAICGGQETNISLEVHSYGILTSNDKKYLLVDNQESGELMIEDDSFILNQNSSSQGSGADLFILNFVK